MTPRDRSSAAVLIMAKAPRPGRVKTRLHPLLGPQGAAALQTVLIRHVAALAAAQAPTFVAFDPPDAADQLRELVPAAVTLFAQRGRHLGERMTAAVDHVAALTRGPVIVVGTDVPTLSRDLLGRAVDGLAGGADAVLGPALDGGYYLIALSAPMPAAFGIDPELWGGDRVLAATLAALARNGRRARLLEPLRDLDTPTDAAALLHDPALPAAVAALLRTGGAAA
jgi:rSAM/selenodomain-associated transferase 1